MQFEPRQTGAPPSPVHPTGFFTGVQIRPVIIGVVVDYVATSVMIYAYFFMYLANQLSKQGEVSSDAITNYMTTTEGLLIGFAIGTLGTAIGGFVAAWTARNLFRCWNGFAFCRLSRLFQPAHLEGMWRRCSRA